MRSNYLLAAFLALTGSLVSASNQPRSNHSTTFNIKWGNCSVAISGIECGQLEVPVDWSHPNGSHITIEIARVNTTNNSSRIGSLLYNPGGPGESAIQLCEAQAAGLPVFSNAVSSVFDIICVDPRGVGLSSPISCDPDLWNQRISLFPKDNNTFAKMVEQNRAFGESCLKMTGDLVKHMDTKSVAKDIEAIRLALNDGKLNFLGESYAAQVGYQYAELFPKNIRAMALDGILDHSESETYALATESSTYESVLDIFFQWCQNNQTCELYGQDVAQIFDEVVAQADTTPIPAPGCINGSRAGQCYANVTGENIRFNAQGFLIFKNSFSPLVSSWQQLGQALNASLHGDATLLSSPAATSLNSTVWQGLAVSCLDGNQGTKTFSQNLYKQELGLAITPHTQMASQSYQTQTQCIGWPAHVKNPPRPLNQEALALAPPILLVNAVHDPETSYVWAQNVLMQMPTAVLLTRNGEGHTSYLLGGEAAAAIDAFLVNGTLPLPNTVVES